MNVPPAADCPADLTTLRDGPGPGDARNMVLMLHGYGASAARWLAQSESWRSAMPHTVFIAPDAPHSLPDSSGRYQWRSLPAPPGEDGMTGVRASAAHVNALIDRELQRYGLRDAQLVLVGFSQGTMMALHVAPRRPQPVAGVLGYSGNLTAPELLAQELRSRPPALLVHGGADPLMPPQTTLDAAATLTALGFTVHTAIVPEMQHGIDARGLALGAEFLARVLA